MGGVALWAPKVNGQGRGIKPVSVSVPLRLICSPKGEFHKIALAVTTQDWREKNHGLLLLTFLVSGAAHETTP